MSEALRKAFNPSLTPSPLQESKGVAKRKAAEQDAAKANRIAKKLRIDMRRRGHVHASRKVSEWEGRRGSSLVCMHITKCGVSLLPGPGGTCMRTLFVHAISPSGHLSVWNDGGLN